ncbi:uncharacterized protein LOC116025122 isoform X1 [Ipomoea triloba]|uniref:uncharacterized protein LOC116025122 isoform X1 n=1 Tax=Ipomoea triloba TaxID=35885 RepID=UPI00125D8FC8|nr:uncharacterized protein LOC116025122 isoform X1 [Ipomoea triloba]
MSSVCSSFNFRVMVALQPHWKHINKNLCYWALSHSRRKLGFSSFSHEEDSPSPTKQSQTTGYDPSEELFGLASDLHPREVVSGASKPRSWFGPNGQYIRELPCPSCRGRGYTPCTECGIERSRLDCSLCTGKGIITCHQCLGDCVIWEESIDERPWEKAQSISPFKMKEDDEVDNLDIKLDAKRKTKRVYQSPRPEVNLKISRSLKSLNAKTGLFSKRMKIIHGDPTLHAQRVAAIKKAKGTAAARKRASDAMKNYFRDPENRRKRSLSMKGARFFCRNCGKEGHRINYCPDIKNLDRRFRCRVCGEKGHNRRTCPKSKLSIPKRKVKKNLHCTTCGERGHNRRTCPEKTDLDSTGSATSISSAASTKKPYTCSLCVTKGHNSRTCPERSKYMETGHNNRRRTPPRPKLVVPRRTMIKNLHCRICGEEGHNRRTCPQNSTSAGN